jgi:nicotinate-nucleotide adenylyltransferase
MTKQRIGILAGTFDPVHAGHIFFALEAMKSANLDKVVFLPERRPPRKQGVEHFGHRTAMITQAIKPYKKLELVELPDMFFNVARTLPQLRKKFPASQLFFLVGSNSAQDMNRANWSQESIKRYFKAGNLIVALREGDDVESLKRSLASLPATPKEIIIITTPSRSVSSTKIREALRNNKVITGLLPSVYRYVKNQWLYVSVNRG